MSDFSSVTAKGFIQCRKSDPNVDECIRGAFQSGIIQLAKGNIIIIRKQNKTVLYIFIFINEY